MKSTVIAGIVVACIVVAGVGAYFLTKAPEKQASLLSVTQKASSAIRVPTDYPTIQEAINAASSGDTISVSSGTYPEHVVVNKAVSLVGENRNTTVIDGGGTGTVVEVNANNIAVSGFTIKNSGSGKKNAAIGISSAYNTISNNILSSSLYGIILHDERAKQNTITGNYFSEIGDEACVMLFGGEGNTIENNTAFTPEAWTFVALGIGGDCAANNNRVVNNSVTGGGMGLWVTNSCGNLLENNTIDNVGLGIYLGYSSQNIIANNNLSNVGREGDWWVGRDAIELFHSSHNTIINNNISMAEISYGYGVILSGSSSNNTLQGNIIENSPRGIGSFNSSDSNEIKNNRVVLNKGYGIILNNSENNIIYRNNFVNNGKQAYDNAETYWDLNGEGNYWSDYEGEDGGGDGVGDTPYSIYPESMDHYPSIEPLALEHPPAPAPEVVPLPTPEGPWYSITGNVMWTNGTKEEGGTGFSIEIHDGGSLTLQNFTLIMPRRASEIKVYSGGALYIYDSKIIPAEGGGGFMFWVLEGAVFEMKNSELRGCGFVGEEWGGIYVRSTTATIENNLITDSHHAITLWPTGVSSLNETSIYVRNNTISDSYRGIKPSVDPGENHIVNNVILNCVEGFAPEEENLPPEGEGIGPSGGSITCNKTRLDVPPNALSVTTSITLKQVSASPPSGYSIVGSAYDIGPIGTTFALPATITLSYDEADLQAGWREEDLAIWRKNGTWQNLGGAVDTGANTVSLEVTSLSEYAILYAGVPGEGAPAAEGIPIVYVVAGVVAIAAAIGLVFALKRR